MYAFLKRFLDILLSATALIILTPVFLITIIGIEISDPGRVFYKARRIGFKGREFLMYKFRSMRPPKTEEEKSEASFKADESRIFTFGRIIRKLKIDELPQLINILFGQMSFVGPRPASIDQVETMREGKYAIANSVRPGLTGPAALYDYIYGDSIKDLEDYKALVLPTRRELEAYYPHHRGFVFDTKIIWWTLVCVLDEFLNRKPDKILAKLKKMAEEEAACATGQKQSEAEDEG